MVAMIKAVVLDVDGVIVGDKEGVNFPYPHGEVIKALKNIRKRGIYVSLCTGKPSFAIEKIIRDAYLNNLHITDGGALGIDPIDKKVFFQYVINSEKILPIAHYYLRHNIYSEFYTSFECFVLKKQAFSAGGKLNEFTRLHNVVMQKEITIVDEIDSILMKKDIIKIFLMAKDLEQKEFISRSFAEKFEDKLTLGWTINPNTMPWQLGLVTSKGISKRKGVEDISKYLNVPLSDILGIGDTMHDWEFMKICGYGAAMENASEKLKELVLQKEARGYVGKSVDEDGVIEIVRHFKLL